MSTGTDRQTRIAARVRALRTLRDQITAELNALEAALEPKPGRRRTQRPPCGTSRGYHWHRANDPDNWPLPDSDPCGCRAGHARETRLRRGEAARSAA